MTAAKLQAALTRRLTGRRVGLDSMVFIYHLSDAPRYGPLVAPLFDLWHQGMGRAAASVLAVLEILVGPLRAGEREKAEKALRYLRAFPNLDLVPASCEIAARAAELRAEHGLRTPDALHAATALVGGVDLFLTNDRAFERVPDLDVVYVSDFLSA